MYTVEKGPFKVSPIMPFLRLFFMSVLNLLIDGAVLCDWSTMFRVEWQPWTDIMQMCYFVTYSRNRIRF